MRFTITCIRANSAKRNILELKHQTIAGYVGSGKGCDRMTEKGIQMSLEQMRKEGMAEKIFVNGEPKYALTKKGIARAKELIAEQQKK
jgi:hypothetical protein